MIRHQRDDAQAFEEAWEARARRSGPIADREVAALVACAEELCRAAVVEPSGEFRAALRTQLLAEATTALAPPTVRTHVRRHRRSGFRVPSYAIRRRLAGATAAFVGAAGFVGMVGASAEALPGEMLYPVKRGVENIELAFQNDDFSRGQYRLAQASERLAEARRLTDSGAPQSQDQVAGTLDTFANQARDGSSALFRAYGQSGSEEPITVVNDFSAAAAADLAILSGRLPGNAGDAFQKAADTVSQLVTKASTLCAACSSADVPGLTGAVSSLNPATSSPTTTGPNAKSEDATSSTESSESDSGSTPKVVVPELPIVQSPEPSSTTSDAPKLRDLTDPTVGNLLGDEDEPGLVGGLVDGLLGGPDD
jgi:hypothetical protein